MDNTDTWVKKRAKIAKSGWENVKISLFPPNKCKKYTVFQWKAYNNKERSKQYASNNYTKALSATNF